MKKACVSDESIEPDYMKIEGYEAAETSVCDGLDNDCDGVKVDLEQSVGTGSGSGATR